MFRAEDIQEKLLHLIGWRQNYDATDLRISDSLTISESGLYFQQEHPLLTLQNLMCVAPNFDKVETPDFEPGILYTKGTVIKHEDVYYVATETGAFEEFNTENWRSTKSLFSYWLEEKTKAGIQKAIARFCSEKAAKGAFKPLCENKTLFTGTGRLVDVVKNRNNLVGFELVPIRAKGITTKINRICLNFTTPGNYTFYLMHSSQAEPVKVITMTKVNKTSQWFDFDDLYLPFQSEAIDAGGSWYLVYYQSQLPEGSQAIKKDRDWSKGPCKSCSRQEFLAWEAWSKYLEIHPFYVNEERTDPENLQMWDVDYNQYTYDNNYGINLEVSVVCDITDFIVEQRSLFADVIAKQVAVDLLREMAFNANVRTNRHTINASKIDILYELDGDSASMKKSGLSYQLELAYKAIKLSTDGLSRVCLPCKNNGVKYRTI